MSCRKEIKLIKGSVFEVWMLSLCLSYVCVSVSDRLLLKAALKHFVMSIRVYYIIIIVILSYGCRINDPPTVNDLNSTS